MSAEKEKDDVDVIPEQSRNLLNALSRSVLPRETKNKLVEMARKVWNGWKVNPHDIEFARKRNGMPKKIGGGATGTVFLAQMKLRDANGSVTPGECMDVVVKLFTVKPADERKEHLQFIREVFLQMKANQTIIVRNFGGYWPDAEEVEDGDNLEPFLVMERMTYNLREVLRMQLLSTFEVKHRILLAFLPV